MLQLSYVPSHIWNRVVEMLPSVLWLTANTRNVQYLLCPNQSWSIIVERPAGLSHVSLLYGHDDY